MTDRAEPGVTPREDVLRGGTQTKRGRRLMDDIFWLRSPNQMRDLVRDALPEIEAELLATATPRPGLVEALREMHRPTEGLRRLHPRTKQPTNDICYECDRPWPCDTYTALAFGTGGPGLDEEVELQLAVVLAAVGPWSRFETSGDFARAIVTEWNGQYAGLANDKGADPTPEPK